MFESLRFYCTKKVVDKSLKQMQEGVSCAAINYHTVHLIICFIITRNNIQSNFDGSNPFGTMKICSRQR